MKLYRIACAALFGAQLFFAAGAAQVVFSREVAALPREHPLRRAAADMVGAMLARLDAVALLLCAVAVVTAVVSSRPRAALLPLFAGLCAAASAVWVTPSIHAMRVGNQIDAPRFGMLHGLSSGLLLLEMILLAIASWIG